MMRFYGVGQKVITERVMIDVFIIPGVLSSVKTDISSDNCQGMFANNATPDHRAELEARLRQWYKCKL